MERIQIIETPNHIGKVVKLSGWINVRRDHGKLIFFDLRDITGIIQSVVIPDKNEVYETAKKIRPEFVVEIEGLVKERPGGAANEKLSTGNVEIETESIRILNESLTPPFEVDKDTADVHEDLRLKYRYLDLRTQRMKHNLVERSKAIKFIRDFYSEKEFIEIETPILTKGTPEGAREYVVPSRIHKGKFYVLPQSPQQFKQMLMVAGLEKYFQIARCFRDEDQRGDRQPEFTQLDLEMSFTSEKEIRELIEESLIALVKNNFPDKNIYQIPFPEIDYKDAMDKYGTDKPDLRKDKKNTDELAFCWIVNFPLFEKAKDGKRTSTHHPFTAPVEEDIDLVEKGPDKARAQAYDLVLNGYEVGGGSVRIHSRDLQQKVFEQLGLDEETINTRFGHILEAFKYGAPPHGGIAVGLDRLLAMLLGESNIREVMAFPKTGEAEDLMMGAPSELGRDQLKEVGIKKNEKTKKTGKIKKIV